MPIKYNDAVKRNEKFSWSAWKIVYSENRRNKVKIWAINPKDKEQLFGYDKKIKEFRERHWRI